MYLVKENVELIKNQLIEQNRIENNKFHIYIDLRAYVKNLTNPAFTTNLSYSTSKEIVEYFNNVKYYTQLYFQAPVTFMYPLQPLDEATLENYPKWYKKDYYYKYYEDEERQEIYVNILEAFNIMKNNSIVNNDDSFVDPTDIHMDELEYIKRVIRTNQVEGFKVIVISREDIFEGYSDIVLLDHKEISKGELEPFIDSEYNKIILSLSGYKPYSIKGVPKIGRKTAEKIISKLLDKNIYIYYNRSSERQLLFPISYEDLANVSNITRLEYNSIVLENWKYLNL